MSEKKKIIIGSNLFLLVIALFIGVVCLYPVSVPTSAKQGVYYHGTKESDCVSLLVNVYWGTQEVYQMLDILDEYQAKATFFIGGAWADDNAQCLKEIVKRGHELGSHGYFHKDCTTLNYAQTAEEITLSRRLILLTTGVDITLFAPPSGAYNDTTVKVCNDLGLKTVLWSKDTVDWRDKDAELAYTRATDGVVGGDFILTHPMAHTVLALPRILKNYQEKGLRAVTVSENITYGG
ncbi:MAG: polysaccharide deacetylase family protein [Clostridia bacterium]|nr:polysaccharide deacetylase family protein [Clostridia bacterium]